MNFTEKYEVRRESHGVTIPANISFDNEGDAINHMDSIARGPGAWRVVRVMEVTVASVSKA